MHQPKESFVYLLTNQRNGTLYVGVTSNLVQRIFQHRNHLVQGFTQKYCVDKLVYFETYPDITSAILREKQLKNWKRVWKIQLIEKNNPNWNDLFYQPT